MDTDRIIYKTLFCDFPIEEVVQHLILEQGEKDGQWFYDTMSRILLEKNHAINKQGISAIVDYYKDNIAKNIHPTQITTPMAASFKQLRHCAEKFFKEQDNRLMVDEKHFLGWNDVTRQTGEDILVCAWYGMLSNEPQTTYAWPDVMECSGDVVKKISQNKLCDIHAHLGGACNPFILNWICLMNGGFMADEQFRDTRNVGFTVFRKWSVVAARIRIAMYRKFLLMQDDAFGNDFKNHLKDIVNTADFFDGRNYVKTLVEQHIKDGKKTYDNKDVDYAIREDCNDVSLDSPYMLWHGERRLLCNFFNAYLSGSNGIKKIARYVYLYCLIQHYFRKIILITQKHMGLSYFNEYNNKKNMFVRDELRAVVNKYAFQTSLRRQTEDGVELRINATPEELIMVKDGRLNNCIFTNGHWIEENQEKKTTFVIHLSKSRYGTCDKNEGMNVQMILEEGLKKNSLFTGIDAAGGEISCRPERLGHHFRYLFERGHRNFTYHVGEDFFDIVDGLRAIDEAVVFLNVNRNWRLGHCAAMGIDVADFYNRNGHRIHLTQQILLDNLVWLLKRCSELCVKVPVKLKNQMLRKAEELYNAIGYTTGFSFDAYYNSMWLRSDVKGVLNVCGKETAWDRSMKCTHTRCVKARKDVIANRMVHEYRVEENIRSKGSRAEEWCTTIDYEHVIARLQKKIMKMIRQLHVGIECCPTSNMMLCDLERYDKTPLLRFRHVLPWKNGRLFVSINTDDKGLFSTSLLNEFSLISSALSKQDGWVSNQQLKDVLIVHYLKKMSSNGYDMRFNWNKNEYGTHQY